MIAGMGVVGVHESGSTGAHHQWRVDGPAVGIPRALDADESGDLHFARIARAALSQPARARTRLLTLMSK